MRCFSVYSVNRGQQHIQGGRACDDAAFAASVKDCRAVAVCDGAGSRKYAREGARTAARISALYMSENFDELYSMPDGRCGASVLYIVRRALSDEADKLGCGVRELGSTLMACAVHDDGRSIILHIGDGVIDRLGEDGSLSVLSEYDHDIAENVTELTTTADAAVREYKSRERCIYMLRTDGAEPVFSVPNIGRHLLSLALLLSEKRFGDECSELFKAPDDSTVAVTGDISLIDTVVSSAADKAVLSMLFGISDKAVKSRRRYYGRVLAAAADHRCTIREMVRLTRQHSAVRTKKKLRPLIKCGLLEYDNGYFTLTRAQSLRRLA